MFELEMTIIGIGFGINISLIFILFALKDIHESLRQINFTIDKLYAKIYKS